MAYEIPLFVVVLVYCLLWLIKYQKIINLHLLTY